MMLLVILLVISGIINLILLFVLVLKYDEAKLNIVSSEGPNGDSIEYFKLHKSDSWLY